MKMIISRNLIGDKVLECGDLYCSIFYPEQFTILQRHPIYGGLLCNQTIKQVVKCVLTASFTNLYAHLVTINK